MPHSGAGILRFSGLPESLHCRGGMAASAELASPCLGSRGRGERDVAGAAAARAGSSLEVCGWLVGKLSILSQNKPCVVPAGPGCGEVASRRWEMASPLLPGGWGHAGGKQNPLQG